MTRDEYAAVKGLLTLSEKMFSYLTEASKYAESGSATLVTMNPPNVQFDDLKFVQKTKAILKAHGEDKK